MPHSHTLSASAAPEAAGTCVPGLVSIVMPVFNAETFLPAAIASVRAQSYSQWELWVIDDRSTDQSRHIATAAARQDSRIRAVSNPGAKGVAGARNAGIAAARGEYIAFLDADDRWLPHKLRTQIGAMQAAGAVFSATGYHMEDEAGRWLGDVPAPPTITLGHMLRSNRIGCLTAMYSQARIGKVWMPAGFPHEDYLTWLTILEQHGPALGVPQLLAVYCRRRDSLSGSKSKAARWQWRIYRQALALPWWRAAWLFGHYAWLGLRKHRL